MVSTDDPPNNTMGDRMGRQLRTVAWSLGALFLVLFLAPAPLGVPEPIRPAVVEGAFLLPYILAIVFSARAAIRAKDAERRFWTMLSASCALIFCNEAYISLTVVTGSLVIGDVPPTMIIALVAAVVFVALFVTTTRLRIPPGVTRVRYAVDAVLVAGLVFIGALALVVEPLLASNPATPLEAKLLAALCPVIGAVIFGGTLLNLLGVKAAAWRGWERLVAMGICLFALGLVSYPFFYISMRVDGAFARGVEAVWMLGMHFVFLAAVYRLTGHEERWGVKVAGPLGLPIATWMTSALLAVSTLGVAYWLLFSRGAQSGATLTTAQAQVFVAAVAGLLVTRTALVTAENHALRASATLDAVTGLPNHRTFHELLAGELEVAARFGEQLSVAIADLDGFGRVNDLMGHPEGDKILRMVGRVLEASSPERSSVCRIAGDEFGIIMPGMGGRAASESCESMRRSLATVMCPALPKVKASFGVASYPAHASVKDELVKLADGAQYWAKLHGKDQVVVYDVEVVEVLSAEDRIGLMQREHVLDTMQALAAAVDARDPGTRFHSRTVAAYAVKLAEDIGMDPDRIRLLEVAAILHDVGKIGVSDSVLMKAGPLTQLERKHVQEHPLLADRILSSTALSEIVPWVVAHHERWDGNGYPYGIPGELIPLEARILAICDAYDAMISDRPYRSALSVEAALQEIDLNIGTQFDPDIAERFIRIVESERMSWNEAAGA